MGMQRYHIGSLDEASRAILSDGVEEVPSESAAPREVFLQSKVWTKALLSAKKSDILCREEMDGLVKGQEERCKLHYALTKPDESWKGLTGRVGKELLEKEVGKCESKDGEELVLICGPEALEKSVHGFLNELGWKDQDLLFF